MSILAGIKGALRAIAMPARVRDVDIQITPEHPCKGALETRGRATTTISAGMLPPLPTTTPRGSEDAASSAEVTKPALTADNCGHAWTNHQWNPQKDVAHRFLGAYVLGMFTETSAAPPAHNTDASAAQEPRKPRVRRKRAPEPKRGQLLVLPSARTGEGKRLREFRAALIAHCGGSPTFTQMVLIDRATVLQHQLTRLDRKAATEGDMSEHQQRRYLAWDGSLRRALLALGLEAAAATKPPPRDIRAVLAEKAAQRAPTGQDAAD